jgi:hypothetical protein
VIENSNTTAPGPQDMIVVMQSRVADKLQGQDGVLKMLDPITWLAIITAVVKLFRECKKKSDAPAIKKSLKSPSLLQKVRFRRHLLGELGRAKMRTLEAPLVQTLSDVGGAATATEIDALYTQLDQE